MKLVNGDCLELMKFLPKNSVDSVVTDPPYGLKFMGKKWDYDVPSTKIWQEVLRVLKPGGHLLSFGGTRTYHRMVINIEDAGFEIRDQIQWLYGSGFPKSHNIGKKLKEWDGYGTSLKPANEPIVLARKALSEKTIVDNVLKWGTGGLDIDGCRVEMAIDDPNLRLNSKNHSFKKDESGFSLHSGNGTRATQDLGFHNSQGRFPANIILDEAAGEMLDEQSGSLKSGAKVESAPNNLNNVYGKNMGGSAASMASTGGASRFFYCAKASKSERGTNNNHPTVKPLKLMTYLVRLVTPPNGTVLDPFMGSGSTGIACKELDRHFIGIEIDNNYFEIASNRIEKRAKK